MLFSSEFPAEKTLFFYHIDSHLVERIIPFFEASKFLSGFPFVGHLVKKQNFLLTVLTKRIIVFDDLPRRWHASM